MQLPLPTSAKESRSESLNIEDYYISTFDSSLVLDFLSTSFTPISESGTTKQ